MEENNIPFENIADYMAGITDWLIIEFVPKSDSQVKRLLATREDIFDTYTQDSFEKCFKRRFNITESHPVTGSDRILYLMRRLD